MTERQSAAVSIAIIVLLTTLVIMRIISWCL
ncbi:hypothetical protein [Rhizobium phage RHEph21]|uniref:Uncharacterized protein n=1 Tax=Rhizobium phage RHEph21 TaxID=2836134 RepID=A0AAE8AX14_9CAUD|nr:hypothetical protein [Rhizobium phage RHEph21]